MARKAGRIPLLHGLILAARLRGEAVAPCSREHPDLSIATDLDDTRRCLESLEAERTDAHVLAVDNGSVVDEAVIIARANSAVAKWSGRQTPNGRCRDRHR